MKKSAENEQQTVLQLYEVMLKNLKSEKSTNPRHTTEIYKLEKRKLAPDTKDEQLLEYAKLAQSNLQSKQENSEEKVESQPAFLGYIQVFLEQAQVLMSTVTQDKSKSGKSIQEARSIPYTTMLYVSHNYLVLNVKKTIGFAPNLKPLFADFLQKNLGETAKLEDTSELVLSPCSRAWYLDNGELMLYWRLPEQPLIQDDFIFITERIMHDLRNLTAAVSGAALSSALITPANFTAENLTMVMEPKKCDRGEVQECCNNFLEDTFGLSPRKPKDEVMKIAASSDTQQYPLNYGSFGFARAFVGINQARAATILTPASNFFGVVEAGCSISAVMKKTNSSVVSSASPLIAPDVAPAGMTDITPAATPRPISGLPNMWVSGTGSSTAMSSTRSSSAASTDSSTASSRSNEFMSDVSASSFGS